MPNWKKVIVSGSNAALNHITSSGNISSSGTITGLSGSFIQLSASYIDLKSTADVDSPPHRPGRLWYGEEDGAINFYNDEADITLQVGQEFWIRAYNPSPSAIPNGAPVRISGSQGDRVRIYTASAEDHVEEEFERENHIIGLATHTIEAGTEGYVTSQGVVRGVDTSAFAAGDTLYLQTGSGGTRFRNDPPGYPYDTIRVGYVAKSASPNGFIFVEPKSSVHVKDISNISGSVVNAQTGDLLTKVGDGGMAFTKTLSGSYTINNGALNVVGNITASGNISASGAIIAGTGTYKGTLEAAKTDVGFALPENSNIYTIDQSGNYLRNLIGKDSDVITIGQYGTSLVDEIRFQPGSTGFTTFRDGSNVEVARVDIAGNITASGNISASGNFTGNSFIKGGGTSAQFLKADGSVDSTSYGTGTVTEVTVGTGLDVTNGTTTPNVTLDLTEVGFGGTAGNLVTDDGDGTVTSQNFLTYDSGTGTLSVLGSKGVSGYISASTSIYAGATITAVEDIVAGGNVTATDIIVGDDVILADNSKIISENTAGTYILLNNDDYWRINANNINVAQFTSAGVVVNEDSAASCDFRVESNNDTHALFVDSGNDKVAIGTSTVGNSLLTIDGDVTATNITASANITASIVRAPQIIGSVQVGAPTIAASDSVATNLIQEETAGGGIEIDTTKANFTGNITASGNISASGTGQFGNSVTVTGTDAILNLYEGSTLQTSLHSRGNTNSFIEAGAGNTAKLGVGTTTPGEKLEVVGNISASGKVYSTNTQHIQASWQSVASATQGTWYGPSNLGPNNEYWATTYGTDSTPTGGGLNGANTGFHIPLKAYITEAKLYIQNISDTTNYAVTGALAVLDAFSYPATAGATINNTTDYTGDLYSTTGVQRAYNEVTITVNQAVDEGAIVYPRFNVNGTTANWRGTFVVKYYEIK